MGEVGNLMRIQTTWIRKMKLPVVSMHNDHQPTSIFGGCAECEARMFCTSMTILSGA